MTELFRDILLRVTLAGVASAAALAVARDGALKEIVRFSAGLLMLLALLQPLLELVRPTSSDGVHAPDSINGMDEITDEILDEITDEIMDKTMDEIAEQNMQTAMNAMGDSISRSLTKRAAELGVDCTFSVVMETDANGTLQIAQISAYFRHGETKVAEISNMIEQECGVPPDKQELVER